MIYCRTFHFRSFEHFDVDLRRPPRGTHYAKRGSPLRKVAHAGWKKYKAAHPMKDFKIPMKKQVNQESTQENEGLKDVDMRDDIRGKDSDREKHLPNVERPFERDTVPERTPLRDLRASDPRMPSRRGQYGTRPSVEQELNIPKALRLDQQDAIMRQAEEQLKSGKLTVDQHNDLLKQLEELYKLQKLHLQSSAEREVVAYSTTPVKPQVIDHAHGALGREKGLGLLPTPDIPPRSVPQHRSDINRPYDHQHTAEHEYPPPGPRGDQRRQGLLPEPTFRPRLEDHGIHSKFEAHGKHDGPYSLRGPNYRFEHHSAARPRFDAPGMQPRSMKPFSHRFESPPGSLRGHGSFAHRHDVPLPSSRRLPQMSIFPGIPPVREMYLDNELREIRFFGHTGITMVNGIPRELRFEGAPRPVFIDGEAFELTFGSSRDIVLDGQVHKIRFGGPTRELLIDGFPFELRFGGPPVLAVINGFEHELRIGGPAPEIILGLERSELKEAVETDMRRRQHGMANASRTDSGRGAPSAVHVPRVTSPPASVMPFLAVSSAPVVVSASQAMLLPAKSVPASFNSMPVETSSAVVKTVSASSSASSTTAVATAVSHVATSVATSMGDVDLRELFKQRNPEAVKEVKATEVKDVPQDQDDRVGLPPEAAATHVTESPASPVLASDDVLPVKPAVKELGDNEPAYMPPAGSFPVGELFLNPVFIHRLRYTDVICVC